MNYAKNMNPDDAVSAIVPMVDANVERASATNLGAGGADRDVVPMVRVDPQRKGGGERGAEVEVHPKVESGEAVERPGIDVRLEFALKR